MRVPSTATDAGVAAIRQDRGRAGPAPGKVCRSWLQCPPVAGAWTGRLMPWRPALYGCVSRQ